MKILYLTTGGSIHDYRFLVKLVERGFETCYAYLEPAGKQFAIPGLKPVYLGPGSLEGDCGAAAGPAGLLPGVKKLLPGPLRKALRGPASLKLYRIYYRNLQRLLREFKPDLLHAGWLFDAGIIAALSGYRPLLLMPWGSDILQLPDEKRFNKAIVRFCLKKADMITCDAEEVKERIISLAGYPADKIVVFPWGIDLGLFKPDAALREKTRRELGWAEKKILVMTRTFKPVYGVDDFIRALPAVFARVPEARALLIGSGPLEGELKALASRLGLADKVNFLGSVSNEALPAYLNAADLYVSSSLSDGTSLSLLEALACALPVVVTDVPAILEWINEGLNGAVIPRREPEKLAAAIPSILEDEALMRQISAHNLGLARERADWDLNFGKLEGIYRQLV